MRIAYFDTIGGIAGDMTLAACISAGVGLEELTAELGKLPLQGFELQASHVRKNAIDAVHLEVVVAHAPHFHRDLGTILGIIERSDLSVRVKHDATEIFRVIGAAEAKIHDVPVEKVHFHEVGALDSIVDIVGAAICLEKLGIERVYSSPVRLGRGGTVKTQHGVMPTPAPATLEILRDYPVQLTDIPEELTTPTGAAIIKATSAGTLSHETLRVSSVGYGAGTKDFAEVPNLLRLVVGELPGHVAEEEIVVVETNIDDMNPQVYPFLIEELLKAGAHDAYLIPIIMKKGRPGILLSVMAEKRRLERITELIYRQTSTIGLRIQTIDRRKLHRRLVTVGTSFGPVNAKVVERDGAEVTMPEFEECKRIARATGRPLTEIMRELEREIAARAGSSPRNEQGEAR
jgi:uncharacterized protein (TIGR00299 family) protein